MFKIKRLSESAIPGALEKAVHYRLLNDPWQAESICLDILEVDPDNQEALYTMILSITDQFTSKYRPRMSKAIELTKKLNDPYLVDYCKGLIYERQAIAAIKRGTPRAGYIAYEYFREAMYWYEKAEKAHPERNEESVLRWNACVRMIKHFKLKEAPREVNIPPLLE